MPPPPPPPPLLLLGVKHRVLGVEHRVPGVPHRVPRVSTRGTTPLDQRPSFQAGQGAEGAVCPGPPPPKRARAEDPEEVCRSCRLGVGMWQWVLGAGQWEWGVGGARTNPSIFWGPPLVR